MANNAITAKSRAIHGKFLTKDDYMVLLHKGTVPAAVAYLKTKPLYASAFADTDETMIRRAQTEFLINKNVFDNYLRICRFSVQSKVGVSTFLIRQLEAEQLIKAVTAVLLGHQDGFWSAFPEYITDSLAFDPTALARAKTLPETADAIKGTMYHRPLAALLCAPEPDINRIVTTINVCYIKWAFNEINTNERPKDRKQLKEFFLRKVDADNLLMCYRMKSAFGLDAARINELMIPYHRRLRQSMIDDALKSADPVAALLALFTRTRVAVSGETDIPEINVNLADHRYFRHRLAVSANETESLYSLMMLFRTESTNLCRIIEGLRYGLPPEEIEKYIIV
ncbi:MAG: V-type ATPase subunit [Ruminiclostridium sp.]|nr:V-type ATPase subunit [Ruminiclostridium sp.]